MKKLILVVSVLSFLCGCGGGGNQSQKMSVSLAPAAQTNLDQGQTLNLTAKVANDAKSAGVSWSMSGASAPGPPCGTFSNKTTTAATYNAPATVSSNMTVKI